MEVTNIFHLQVPPNEADALWETMGWSPMQFSGVESAIEFLINLLMVFSQRIDVARHSNMMNAGAPKDGQNGTILRWRTSCT